MPSAEEVRAAQRSTWDGLAPSWDKWDALIQRQLAPMGAAMVEGLGLGDRQRHLDVACGTGEPGLSIARLAPAGRVTLTDIAPEMLEVAARRAAAEGLGNVDTRVCSADDLPFDDAAFDSVTMRLGYMFLPDLALATSELVRVLRPGGRLATSVWGHREDNPWTTVALDAVATEIPLPPVAPDAPSIFRCAEPGLVTALFDRAGLHDVTEQEVAVELVAATPLEYWAVISEHVAPVAAALGRADEEQRARISKRALAALAAYQQPDGTVHVPGSARVILGSR